MPSRSGGMCSAARRLDLAQPEGRHAAEVRHDAVIVDPNGKDFREHIALLNSDLARS